LERGICSIAVLYFAVRRCFFNIKNFVGQKWYKFYHILGNVMLSVMWA